MDHSCQPQMKKRSENLCQLSKISDNSQIISCAFLKKTEINISKCYFTRGKCVMSSKRFHWLNSLANHNNLLIFLLAREIGLHFRSYFGIYFLTLKIFWKKREIRCLCRESVRFVPKAWVSRQKRESWQVCIYWHCLLISNKLFQCRKVLERQE